LVEPGAALTFGTDGVRGDAEQDLTPGAMFALGRAVTRVLGADRFLIGRDTRASGPRIEHDLAAGMAAEGATATRLGVFPTPAIAYSAAQANVPAAIVSASHNPWTDNGVKVIGADGYKLADDVEAAIARESAALPDAGDGAAARDGSVERDAADAYVAHLVRALDGRSLAGMNVVLDCANGAAFAVGPRVLRAAGAEVNVVNATPDGQNINRACGSTDPSGARRAVEAGDAVLGLALDGDADRVIAIDERGAIVDGDQIMAITAIDLHARDLLPGNAVVVTVMSNLGLRRALRDAGIDVIETPVGDRHVVAAMRAHGVAIGGEQSGHIVYAQHATTGDGLLTGLLLADVVQRWGRPLSELAAVVVRYPQVLVNVAVARRIDDTNVPAVEESVRAIEAELGERGRVLVRASGTEPVVRVMAEAETHEAAERVVERLRTVVEREFGLAGSP
jgi:phosphoglucosamine mutase